MGSFSGLVIGLSFLFGSFTIGIVAELCYVLWWKKRYTNRGIEDPLPPKDAIKVSYLFCLKNPRPLEKPEDVNNGGHRQEEEEEEEDLELGRNKKDLVQKNNGEEGLDSELMRLHSLCGPPRFLFTIKEETTEDLESDDEKSSGERSSRKLSKNTKKLSELLAYDDDDTSPNLTPLASPTLKFQSLDSFNHHHQGFNPWFESSTDFEKNATPSKFKFLRDAEDKFHKKLMEEAERKCQSNGESVEDINVIRKEKKDDSFVRKCKQREAHCHFPSNKVLPLATSPSEI